MILTNTSPSLLHTCLDHDDPSKPSHRLTNGPYPSKTIESNGSKIEKPLVTMVRLSEKHSMVIVFSKTIECVKGVSLKPLKISMVS